MISRIADHCYWFGRYLERLESTTRLLAVTRNLALGGGATGLELWSPVVTVTGEHDRFTLKPSDAPGEYGEAVERYLTWDEQSAASLLSTLRALRENGRSMREVISLETWSSLNALWLRFKEDRGNMMWKTDRAQFYGRVINGSQFVAGLLMSTMLRDAPLDFIRLGMMVERAGQTARALDVHHHSIRLSQSHQVVETSMWLGLLRACCGYEPFMKRYRGKVTGDAVAAFLLCDARFPRSVAFAVNQGAGRLLAIRPRESDPSLPGAKSREYMADLQRWLTRLEPADVVGDELHAVLTHVIGRLHTASDVIGSEYLGYAQISEASQSS